MVLSSLLTPTPVPTCFRVDSFPVCPPIRTPALLRDLLVATPIIRQDGDGPSTIATVATILIRRFMRPIFRPCVPWNPWLLCCSARIHLPTTGTK